MRAAAGARTHLELEVAAGAVAEELGRGGVLSAPATDARAYKPPAPGPPAPTPSRPPRPRGSHCRSSSRPAARDPGRLFGGKCSASRLRSAVHSARA